MKKLEARGWARRLSIGTLVGVIAACEGAPPPADSAGRDPAALGQRVATAAATLDRIEAIGAVKRLQHAYGHYSELGLWHDFADLFSDTAVGHYTQGDLGREEIRKLFVEQVGQGILGLAEGRIYPHISLTPVVTLSPDGQTAKARWRIVAMLGAYGRSASWARGVYENVYAKERGVWKVQEVTFSNQISGRYGESLRLTLDGPMSAPTTAFHYEPRDVGAALLPVGADSAVSDATVGALAAALSELEPRVARLLDERAVLNLQNAYGYYWDRKLWDDVADLFAGDGTLEYGQGGVYVGKASIRRGLEQFGPAGLREGEVNDYLQLQPVVSIVDGSTARARGVYLGMTGTVGVGAEWREGIYENEYVKQDGVWKISALHVYPRLVTDYDKGWAESAEPVNGPSEAFPPDRPPTSVYQSYPKFVIPPFHFRHPVTGRSPQYPSGFDGEDALAVEPPKPSSAARTVDELAARLAVLEQRLDELASAEAAENLVNAFSYYADEHMWAAAADLFANDAWAEVHGVGVYAGRERLRDALQGVYGDRREGVLRFHQVLQPVIDPAADAGGARIRSRLAEIDVSHEGDDFYAAGVYEALVRNEAGAWKIAALDLDPTWAASHSRGWARTAGADDDEAFAVRRPNDLPAPDLPLRGPAMPPFPAILDVPFHYANPVSGRPPAVDSFEN